MVALQVLLLCLASFTPGVVFLTADLIAKIDAFLRKDVRWGYSCELKCLSDRLLLLLLLLFIHYAEAAKQYAEHKRHTYVQYTKRKQYTTIKQ